MGWDGMGKAYSMKGAKRNAYRILVARQKKRDNRNGLSVYG
jgi:hypothetical protein